MLLERRLGLRHRARADVGGLCAQLDPRPGGQRGEPDPAASVERRRDLMWRDVELMGVVVVEGGADVLPVIGQRRRQLLVGGDQHLGLGRDQVEQRVEAVGGEQLGDVRPPVGPAERGDRRQLAMLRCELGRRGDLDALEIAERALCEGGEAAQRLDLDVEEVHPDRVILRRGKEVEDPPADRELPAVLHLIYTLVARGNEIDGRLLEVDEIALAEREPSGAKLRVRHLLAQRDCGDDDDRWIVAARAGCGQQRIERRDAQADQMRRRREMRLVGDAAARREAHLPRRKPRPQIGRQLLRLTVVACDDDCRAAGSECVVYPIKQRRDQERPQRS
ncbi:unannotated protein [freshwater metagenome]|uniref:Unannotated protein n=1 Tax=freshwater metagenome TaxID=449393 RepID=A0A6J7EIU4_9ZZZZ